MLRRVPNLLDTFLFLSLTVVCFVAAEGLMLALAPGSVRVALANQRLQIPVEGAAYVLALALASFAFGALWQRSFWVGIAWRAAALRPVLAVAGLLVGFVAQAATTLISVKKDIPIEGLFRNAGLIWALAVLGVVIAPVFEEIVFRGFLLPAIAAAVDWMRLPRVTPEEAVEELERWQAAEGFSMAALVIASLITSLLFALIHAPQLGYTWAAIGLLGGVSLVLCWVRIRTDSVAASSLFHGCYNLSVFVTIYVATGGFRHMDRL